jgi:hypothetical protein
MKNLQRRLVVTRSAASAKAATAMRWTALDSQHRRARSRVEPMKNLQRRLVVTRSAASVKAAGG